MEPSHKLNCALRIKEEPSDAPLVENNWEMMDEKPDLEHFQLLPFLRENSTHTLQKCGMKLENVLEDEVKIIVECEDVKPNVGLLAVGKNENYSPNHLQNIKHSKDYKLQNMMKVETAGEVQQENIDNVTEELSLNLDCGVVKQNKKKRITKRFKNELNLNTHITVHNDTSHACDACEKKLSCKSKLKIHIESVHKKIAHGCDNCRKQFSTKSNLKTHISTVHNNVKYPCEICGKKFTDRSNLNRHVKSLHNYTTHSCAICEEKFTRKDYLQNHVETVHNGVTHTCDICGKPFSQKGHLKIHVDSVHMGNKHACDVCGKNFANKCNLNKHVDGVHDCITHECDICKKTFTRKDSLQTHIDTVHDGVVKYSCGMCGKKSSTKSNLKTHINAIHNGVTRAHHNKNLNYARNSKVKVALTSE
ncbi:zinc finger protein OZF-like [Trichogramma pretiosum]|uniref:zinc finger protein OZF-like n=1 Tax=Trichogramma pretiosum TaxID=7493 RepID=UPI0006C99229|nr:zinc finger protein OZF-like [Trichogramma pretiosum]